MTYTKGPGIGTYRTVQFTYEARTDTERGYYQSGAQQTNQRLKYISISSAVTAQSPSGVLVRKYRLDYECGDTNTDNCPGTSTWSTWRSRLKQVVEIGSDGVSEMPPQRFSWQYDKGYPIPDVQSLLPDNWGSSSYTWVGDFNGDGITDIASANGGNIYVNLGAGNGGFTQYLWTVPNNWGSSSYTWVGDFNGDGKTDIASANGGNIYVNLSTGTGFTQAVWTVPANWGSSSYTWVGDFNGDGKTDIASANGGNIYVNISTGSGFTQQVWTVPSNWGDPAHTWVGDFNGDGKTDIASDLGVNVYPRNIYVNISTGSGFTQRVWQVPNLWGDSAYTWVGDFNGDGKTDIASRYVSTSGTSIVAMLSTGSQFVMYQWAVPNNWGDSTHTWAADFNGDGKTDIASANGGNIYVNLSSGSGFTQVLWTVTNVWGDSAYTWVGDFDGNGKADIATRLGSPYVPGIEEKRSSPVAPDLLASIDNGIGGTISIAYAPAPQVPGAIVPGGLYQSLPGIPNTSPQQLARTVSTYDGRGGRYVTSYGYSNARIIPGNPQQQRFLGFQAITITDEQTHQHVQNTYVQTPGCEGHLDSVVSYGSGGALQSQTNYGYQLTNPSAGTELCLEVSQVATRYEQGVGGSRQTTTTAYDGYANPTVKTQDASTVGAGGSNLPTVTITTQFAPPDTANWILGRITDIKTTSGSKTLGEVTNTWTNNTITAKSEWLDSAGGWLTTSMTYDANGNLATVTSPPAADGLVRKTTTEYDATYRAYPAKVTNAKGQSTLSSYNDDGSITSSTDVNRNVTTTTYDLFWRKLTEARPDTGTTTYSYVNYGNAGGYPNGQYMGTVTTVGAGRTAFRQEFFDGTGFKFQTVASGDCTGGVFTEVQRDAAGRPWKTSLPHCSGDTPAWTTTTYDVMSRVATVTTPDNKTTTYGYGADSYYGTLFESVMDANGQRRIRYFTARDKVASVVDAANQTTSYGYDELGRLTSVTLPNGDITTQTWDSLNRKTSSTVRLASSQAPVTTTTSYDDVGNLTNASVAGKTVIFSYDELNRVVTRQPVGETAATYTYDESWSADGAGRLTTQTDAGGTMKFGYTKIGQVATATRTLDGSSFTQGFTYDLLGRVTTLTYPDGSQASYTYTDGGEHASATLTINNAVAASVTWTGFNAAGKPAGVSFNNGVATSYGYDVMNHLTSLTTSKGSTQLQNLTYDWYSAPNTGGLNLGSITDHRSNTIAPDGSNTTETQSFTYDSLYRLAQAVGVWGTKAYTYDVMGNPIGFGGVVNRTIFYDDMQAVSGTSLTASYDASGNMIHKVLDGTIWDYTWTVDNKLATASKNGALASQMIYGSDGQRVKKIFYPVKRKDPTVTTTYVGNIYEKRTYSDSTPERHTIYLYANGQLVASVTRSGSIQTAFNNPTQWRNQWARMKMYNGGSAIGAVMKTGYFIAAVASHPVVLRWGPLAIFGLLALALLIAFIRSSSTWSASYRFAPRLRFAALSLVLMFTFTACFGNHSDPQRTGDRLIAGNTTQGPAIGTYYFHRNHINSSSLVTDSGGNEVTRMVYLPFGEISQPNSWGNDTVTSKFTGQEYDAETGLYAFGARYYDPAIGRFVSADTSVPNVEDSQSFNRYTYARDNPIVYTDPTGHSFWSFVSHIYHAIANAIGSAMRALAQAATWVANRLADAGKFLINGCKFAFLIAKSMAIAATHNPMAALGILLAIAAGPPGWIGLAVGIAAQGMALAAGIHNPMVLALIGAVAGAAGAGVTAMLMAGAKFGIERALVSAGVSPVLVAVGSMMANVAVNELTQDPEPDGAEASGEGSAESTSSDPVLADNSSPESSDGTATDAPAHDYYGTQHAASDGSGGGEPSGSVSISATIERMAKSDVIVGAFKIAWGVATFIHVMAAIGGHGLMGAAIASAAVTPIGAVLVGALVIASVGMVAWGMTDIAIGLTKPRRRRRRRAWRTTAGLELVACGSSG